MSSYPSLRNPLLPSPPPSNKKFISTDLFLSASNLTRSISTASIRSFVHKRFGEISHNRRIMPDQKFSRSYLSQKDVLALEPLVHYNGPCHTLETLPQEKLDWIKHENPSTLVKNPLTHYRQSIVLRKPIKRSQTYPSFSKANHSTTRISPKPKGMFYLRILQIICTDSAKVKSFRCGVQVNQEVCLSSSVLSEKTGKHSSIAQFDETFLFDIDDPTSATLSVYTQNKSNNVFSSQKLKQEVCIGQEVIDIPLRPKAKSTERFVLNTSTGSTDIQLLVVYGTFVSHKTQNIMNNKILFEDFVTIYVHTTATPRLDRFWGVLRGLRFELFDFEYKENRPPLYVIPLDNYIGPCDESLIESGIDIDLGSNCIALEFQETAVKRKDRTEMSHYRMYLLSESTTAKKEWERQFEYVASYYDEVARDDQSQTDSSEYTETSDSSSYFEDYQEEERDEMFVPVKLLW